MNTYLISSNKGVSNTLKSICDKYDVRVLTIDFIEDVNENWWNEKIHTFFIENYIERIVIPVSLPENNSNYFGLEIGLHIRLDYMIPIEDRCIPIVFLSDLSFNNLVTSCPKNSSSNPHLLLLTKGVSVCDVFDLSSILSTESEGLSTNEYQSFLRQLNVNRKDTMGNHDIANAWGCYKMAQLVGIENFILKNQKVKEKLGQLYAKWLICSNNAYIKEEIKEKASLISCKGKKILYIDDKADEGWGDLLKHIFKEAGDGFKFVDPAKYKVNNIFNYNDFRRKCESYIGQRWDLVIIDLRLNPLAEDVDNVDIEPKNLSGCTLIDMFMEVNEGYQIMVLTASNKIWNVYESLRKGARRFFIKESPVFSKDLKQNVSLYNKSFVSSVNKCLSDSYLYDIYDSICKLGDLFLPDDDFGEEIYQQLMISFELLKNASEKNQYAYAYISLYMVIEIINKEKNQGQKLVNYSVEFEKIYLEKNEMGEYSYWDTTKDKRIVSKERQVSNEVLLEYYIEKDKDYKILFEKKDSIKKIKKIQYSDASSFIRIANFMKACEEFDDKTIIDVSHRIKARNWFIHKDEEKLTNVNNSIERDIYTKKGFIKLFNTISRICIHL